MSHDYNVQKVGNEYKIHKWDGGTIPVTTYTITLDHNNKMKCNCPSGQYRGYCKHREMVKEYRKKERAGEENIVMFVGDET